MDSSPPSDNAKRHPCEALFREVVEDPRVASIEAMVARYKTEAQDYAGSGIYEICLGMLWLQGKRYPEARAAFEDGLRTENTFHQKLHYALVSAEIEQAHFAEAREAADALTKMYPEWPGGERLLMLAAMGEGVWAEAITHGEKALEYSPDPSVYLGLTIAHHHLGQHREAVTALRQALLLDPTLVAQPIGVTQGIHSYLQLGMHPDAAHLVEARQRLDPRWERDEALQRAIDILSKVYPSGT